MSKLQDYKDKYKHVKFDRTGGVLVMTLHTDGGPLEWGGAPHRELHHCFEDVGTDEENEVIIITGAGDEFIGSMRFPPLDRVLPSQVGLQRTEGAKLLQNLLAIPVPVIGAVNGPARVHSELALLADIVIASDCAVFQDAPHFMSGLVPGDGIQVVWQMLIGPNRARYFLLTGQEISAAEALSLGVVSEVVPRARLLGRALELAELLMRQPTLVRRFSRSVLIRDLQRRLFEELGYSFAMEHLARTETFPSGKHISSKDRR